MLVSFFPSNIGPKNMDLYSKIKNMPNSYGSDTEHLQILSTNIALIAANSINLVDKLQGYCVDYSSLKVINFDTLDIKLVLIELKSRYGYLCLFKGPELKYVSYCGEITCMLFLKSLFTELPSSMVYNTIQNFCISCKIDDIITAKFSNEVHKYYRPITINNYTYFMLGGSVIKCEKMGYGKRELCVKEKTFITQKIPDIYKIFSKAPESLLKYSDIAAKLNNTTGFTNDLFSSTKIPVARLALSTALSDINNKADLIVAMSQTRQQDSLCTHLSNAWLKRAISKKLNRYPAEQTTDGKYEVEKLTTEATIKYVGENWRGATQSDEIYLIRNCKTKQTVDIIAMNTEDYELIWAKRNKIVKSLENSSNSCYSPLEITITFENEFLDTEVLDRYMNLVRLNILAHDKKGPNDIDLCSIAGLEERVANGEKIPSIDLFRMSTLHDFYCMKLTFVHYLNEKIKERYAYRERCDSTINIYITHKCGFEVERAMDKDTLGKAIKLLSISCKPVPVQKHSFNFDKVIINYGNKTCQGYVKYGLAQLNNPENTIIMLPSSLLTYTSDYTYEENGPFMYSDYLFCTATMYDSRKASMGIAAHVAELRCTSSLPLTNAIYGKRFMQSNALVSSYSVKYPFNRNTATFPYIHVMAGELYKAAATGYADYNNTLVNNYFIGYVPDTIEAYRQLIMQEDAYEQTLNESKITHDITAVEKSLANLDFDDLEQELGLNDSELFDDSDFTDNAEIDDTDIDLDSVTPVNKQTNNTDLSSSDLEDFDFDDELSPDDSSTLSDDFDMDFDEDLSENAINENNDDDAWNVQRTIYLSQHHNEIHINGVYWFDAMHQLIAPDDPENANNFAFLKNIWDSMLNKMAVSERELLKITLAELNKETEEDISDDDTFEVDLSTNTTSTNNVTNETDNKSGEEEADLLEDEDDLLDDDDDLFAGL